MSGTTPVLEIRNLSKQFSDVKANDDISFTVNAGQVHALLGENGAGKSTLVKMLYGVYHPDKGDILVNGKKTVISNPTAARLNGIGLVFQDMRLIPAMKVWENIALFLADTPLVLDEKKLVDRIREISQKWNLEVNPEAKVSDLSIGEWQRIELLKVLIQGAKILILDEPTSVLTPAEVDALFAIVRQLRDSGVAVIIITHKMREVRDIADSVTILRKGKVAVRDVPVNEITDAQLVEAMVGHALQPLTHDSVAQYGARPVMELVKINKTRADGTIGLRDFTLRLYPGEVLGVAGISGNGQKELADIMAGYLKPDSGDIVLDDHGKHGGLKGGFIRDGVMSIPADPIQETVIPNMSIAEHAALWEHALGKVHGFDVKKASKRLEENARKVGLTIPKPTRIMSELSGGNIQRVILTLAISSASKVLIASYPTRGLDIGTTNDTRKALMKVREKGCTVVLISEDIDEILEMSDRVIVLQDGRINGLLQNESMTRNNIAELMTGTRIEGGEEK